MAANDVIAAHGGYRKYRGALIDGGVQMHEIRAQSHRATTRAFDSSSASLHTKALVVDDARGFIGSFNLDPRSANLNTEMGVLFDDPVLGAALRDEYLRLARPALSYRVLRGKDRELRWLDAAASPPALLNDEPEASAWLRGLLRILGRLPIESQL